MHTFIWSAHKMGSSDFNKYILYIPCKLRWGFFFPFNKVFLSKFLKLQNLCKMDITTIGLFCSIDDVITQCCAIYILLVYILTPNPKPIHSRKWKITFFACWFIAFIFMLHLFWTVHSVVFHSYNFNDTQRMLFFFWIHFRL